MFKQFLIMNYFYKVLIIACFIFSSVGVIAIINNVRLHPIQFSSTTVEVIGFLFWYLQPIFGIILIWAPKQRVLRYFGIFFLGLSLLAWFTYIFRP